MDIKYSFSGNDFVRGNKWRLMLLFLGIQNALFTQLAALNVDLHYCVKQMKRNNIIIER